MPQNLVSIVIVDALATGLAATAQRLEEFLAGETVSTGFYGPPLQYTLGVRCDPIRMRKDRPV